MQPILIQLEGKLLWQILVEADPIALQALDELLLILASEAPLVGQAPVVACCTEADWAWLRTQIQSHYPFDLAEELLLRLDVMRLGSPASDELVYASLSHAAGTGPGHLSLTEFLELYHTICSLESLYHRLARPGYQSPLAATAAEHPPQRLAPDLVQELGIGQPSLTKQQTRLLLVSLALLLALLPHWSRLQALVQAQAQAQDADPGSEKQAPTSLAALSQSAQAWLKIALGSSPAKESAQQPTQQVAQQVAQQSAQQPVEPGQSAHSRNSEHEDLANQQLGAEQFRPGPDSIAPNQPATSTTRLAPVGHLSPLIQPLSQSILAVANLDRDRSDLATSSAPGQQADPKSSGSSPAAIGQPFPATPLRQPDPNPNPDPSGAQPLRPVSPQPVLPEPFATPQPSEPALPSSPGQLADSRPTDLTIAQRPDGSPALPSDPLLGVGSQVGPLSGADELLGAIASLNPKPVEVTKQGVEPTFIPNQFTSAQLTPSPLTPNPLTPNQPAPDSMVARQEQIATPAVDPVSEATLLAFNQPQLGSITGSTAPSLGLA